MKRWVFTGISDKHELLLYLCKIMTSTNKKVLLTDATTTGKYGYSIGSIDSRLRLTEFCGFDVAAGFTSEHELEKEVFELGSLSGVYDYLLLDINVADCGCYDVWHTADQIVWMTTFERYDIEQSKRWFEMLFKKYPDLKGMRVQPVYIQAVDSRLDHKYIMSCMEELPITWNEEAIVVPWDEVSIAIHLENMHTQNLKIHPISRQYKKALMTLVEHLAGWDKSESRKALRIAERKRA